MTTKKKLFTAILSLALVAVVTVGGTFAYLSANAGEKTNVFTFADNIRGTLGEPNWNPEDGKDLTPGKEIKKDPIITNTSTNGVEEYAAVKVTFQSGKNTGTEDAPVYTDLSDTDAARLLTLIEIDWNTTDWTLINGTATGANQTYAYNHKLAPGEVSNPLFNSVKIKGDISDADMSWLAGISLSHTPDCYTYGTHEDAKCTITHKHHVDCALSKALAAGVLTADQVAAAEKGATVTGTDSKNYKCDCTPAEQHSADCPSLIGTLKPNCGHTVANSIQGFNIKNAGAVLQADQFTSATDTAAVAAFKTLFGD